MSDLNPTTLEDLLRMTVKVESTSGGKIEMSPDFKVSVQRKKSDRIHFLIRPEGYDGQTLDFVVQGNVIEPLVEEVNGKIFQGETT